MACRPSRGITSVRKVILHIAVLLLFSSSACAQAGDGTSKVVEIPLKEVWALDMPGMRPINELEPGERIGAAKMAYGPLTMGILEYAQVGRHSHGRRIGPNGPGMAVAGRDLAALETAHALLTGKQKPATSISGEVTIVFHTIAAAPFIRLDSGQRRGKTITIAYHFYFTPTLEGHSPFALIPVGELEPGKYDVRFHENSYETADRREKVARKDTSRLVREVVCKDFSFEVTKPVD